jgi:hypothetical protein
MLMGCRQHMDGFGWPRNEHLIFTRFISHLPLSLAGMTFAVMVITSISYLRLNNIRAKTFDTGQ